MGQKETLKEVGEQSIATGVNQVLTSREIKKLINDAKIKTYYLYSSTPTKLSVMRSPVVTVCLMHVPELNLWARGVAVCSPKDTPEKAEGKLHAKRNAGILLATVLKPNRTLYRELTDDVKKILAQHAIACKTHSVKKTMDYVPSIRNNDFIKSIIWRVNTTAKKRDLTDSDKDLENEINPVFTPHEQRLLAEKKTTVL
jgi:hypothetical protein